ncbi:ankyrin [Colletotrichum falcatum]|nr:ankyrin [Colletotrichum falcatum]
MLLGTGQTSIDSRDNTGRTSLSLAAAKRNEAVVNILLDTGRADINSSDSAGRTPLYWAAGKGHVNVVSSLVDSRNADINVRDQDGFSPFMRAVWRSNKEVVRILLQTGLLSNHSCMDGLFYQAFWFMLADELDQFMVNIGYAVGNDFFGLRGLFGEL